MNRIPSTTSTISSLRSFLFRRRRHPGLSAPTAVSLFSGAGISDMGYRLAGFRLCVQVEKDEARAGIGKANFPESVWLRKDVLVAHGDVVAAYRRASSARLALLVVTPPCQGMSSSNPSRGKRKTQKARRNEAKNRLLLETVPIARELVPRLIVSENVRQILTLATRQDGKEARVLDLLAGELRDYAFFETTIDIADYGVPQTRRRAVVVGVRRDEPCLVELQQRRKLPWPKPTHAECSCAGRAPWISLRRWFEAMGYPFLSSRTPQTARDGHPLHFVPDYDEDRHLLVSSIPPHSGRSAYENDVCPSCGQTPVPTGLATCNVCQRPMRNRPIVLKQNGAARLVRGFNSSYRRMSSGKPAPPVMTNSSHIGSDNKIHPWEHRVLSILETADLQTVPRFFNWSLALDRGRTYLIRNVVGEALPTYFAYLHGRVLRALLEGKSGAYGGLAVP